MSAEHEELIIDRVSDVEDADDQLLAEDKVEEKETAEVEAVETEEDIPEIGRASCRERV